MLMSEMTPEAEDMDDALLDDLCRQYGFCGCGNPELAAQKLRDVLRLVEARTQAGFSEASNKELEGATPLGGMYWLFWYWMNHFGVVEHGGSAAGSWLTDEGRELLARLEADPAIDEAPEE